MSGASNFFHGKFDGAAGDVTVNVVPFRPRFVKLWVDTGAWGVKSDDMPDDDYQSSVAADDGVTITADGFDVANGADINVAGHVTYYECRD